MSYIKTCRENVMIYNKNGEEYGELQDLLAILIGNSATPELTGRLASMGIIELGRMNVLELENAGLSKLKALEIHSAFKLAKKYLSLKDKKAVNVIRCVEDVVNHVQDISYSNQEHFAVIYLNPQNEIITKKILFTGSMKEMHVSPREIFQEAYKYSAASIVICHNHVTNDCSPSQFDVDMTFKLYEASKLLGIEILDHVIVSQGKHLSLKDKGYF